MKLVFVVVLLLAIALSELHATEIDEAWEQFKKSYNKNYGEIVEHDYRKKIFGVRYQKIQEHNKRYETGKETYKQKINKFADLTKNELRSVHPHGIKKNNEKSSNT